MTTVFSAFKDLLFPPSCVGCKRRLEFSRPPLLCSACAANLAFIRSPLCDCCGRPFAAGADHLCGDCLTGCNAFDLARSVFLYRPPLSDLILSLKFTGDLTALATVEALMARELFLDAFTEPDLILPVPLPVERLRQRGFNQALLIAKGCLPGWKRKIVAETVLHRRPATPQSLLSGKERRSNLRNVFTLGKADRVTGARILLVDDVYTTGSTVNECSKILRAGGARRIEVFTLARSLIL